MRSNLQENFYKRLKELSGVKSSNNPTLPLNNSTLINYTRTNDGVALGIVKENHNYFIKTSNVKGNDIGVENFSYINGIENKYKYQYNSLSEAEKNRNFYINTLNESTSKKFKKISISENENIDNAQSNADKLNSEKAQDEANKNMTINGDNLVSTKTKEVDLTKKTSSPIKVVDSTKESSTKPISVEKQVKTIKENINDDNEKSISSDEPIMPAGEKPAAEANPNAKSDAETSTNDDESNDLDAAAKALDDMGVEPEEESEPAETTNDDSPENPENNEPDTNVDNTEDSSIKDIEKLTGKVTQKIRSSVLTPSMTKGFLKSFISSFEDKLGDLDYEDRKELSNSILKDKSTEDSDTSLDENTEEAEIEEAINQHLAEMGIDDNGDIVDNEKIETNTKPFKEYMVDRGYNPDKIEEISLMEMVGLVNGYTNECGEEYADADEMSDYITPEVNDKMYESGNSIYENLMKPFGEKIKINKKKYATESVIPMNEDMYEEDEMEPEYGDDNSPENSISVGEDEMDEPNDDETEISIAPASQPIAIGTPVGTTNNGEKKNVTVDLKNDTVNITMNEAEIKLRKIVQNKIKEKLSGKKTSINESKKSALSIMIDELVNEAIQKRRKAIEERLMKK